MRNQVLANHHSDIVFSASFLDIVANLTATPYLIITNKNITVLGAGVNGLTIALELSTNPNYHITVLAKHMPGDYSIEYASPWAGANYDTFSPLGSAANELEKHTWPRFRDLAMNHVDAGVWFQDSKCVMRTKDRGTERYEGMRDSERNHPWLRHWRLPEDEVPQGVDEVVCFESVCINTVIYLPWLVGRCLKNGVVLSRAELRHIRDSAKGDRQLDVIVNCTGLGAKVLGGVGDERMTPARGQVVIVTEESDAMYSVSGIDGPEEDRDYSMMRAAGGGTVLDGCYQLGSWESKIDQDLAKRIMARAIEACPKLVEGKGSKKLSIIKHGVGLRPVREGGARIEREVLDGMIVVHCYGHRGAGYQQSYVSATAVLRLVSDSFNER